MNRIKFIIFSLMIIGCQSAKAYSWQDLWHTHDQQGARALERGHAEKAAQLFKSPSWRAAANYRAGKYATAMREYTQMDNAASNYNRGNALAYMGEYKEAIESYKLALKEAPKFTDATHNIQVLKKLLKQQHKQKKHSDKKSSQKQQAKNEKKSANNKTPQQTKQKKTNPQKNHKQQKDSQQAGKKQTPMQQQAQNNQKQASLKQWLDRVPDDPGGLLRQKFLRDHKRYQLEQAKKKRL